MPRGSSPPPPSPHTSCCSLSGGNRVGAIPQQHYLCSHIPSSSDTITMPPPFAEPGLSCNPSQVPAPAPEPGFSPEAAALLSSHPCPLFLATALLCASVASSVKQRAEPTHTSRTVVKSKGGDICRSQK